MVKDKLKALSPREVGGRVFAIVGGSGFIGGHLVRALATDSTVRRVYVLDRVPTNQWSEKIQYRYVNIDREISLDLPEAVDGIFHLAALCREPGYPWDQYFRTNHEGTRNVVAWAERHDIRSIVFTSTAMVFRAGPAMRAEHDVLDADTAYGISKALAEEVLRGWQARVTSGTRKLAIVRPGAVFGQGCGGNFVNLHRSLKLGTFAYVGQPDTVKSCIYVKDLVGLLIHLMRRETSSPDVAIAHGAYPRATSIQAICEAFCEVFGWRRVIPTVPFKAALVASLPFQILNELGVKNPIHRRRVEKLFYSTHLGADRLEELGYRLKYSLVQALQDWRVSCSPIEPY